MSALGQRMLGAVLVVAFASFYVWHGGKAALFLSMIATLMLASALSIHFFGPRNINIRRQMHANRVVAGERTTVAVELKFDCPIPLLWIILCENTPAGVHRKLLFPEPVASLRINMNYRVCEEVCTDGNQGNCIGVIFSDGIRPLQRR
ncbi:hypothetical protein [Paenibacillus sp. 1A_MP2]|uniref:hypothetical protein n=1 Tax=Paenibacillus sp. 1A_MP2 TaxID=3457495 RepID=UPI003FCD2F48